VIVWATGRAYSAPRPPTWILGVLLLREARGEEEAKTGKGRDRKGEGKEREAGPSFPLPLRYATGSDEPFAAFGTLGDLTWLEDFLINQNQIKYDFNNG